MFNSDDICPRLCQPLMRGEW